MLDFEHVAKMPRAWRRLFTALRELHLQLPLNLLRISSLTSCFSDNLFFFYDKQYSHKQCCDAGAHLKSSRDEFGAEQKKRSSKPKTTRSHHSSAAKPAGVSNNCMRQALTG